MKRLLPALTGLIVLCASWCAPAFSSPPTRGSTVLAPPLISKGHIKSKRPSAVLRLPTQAGKVRQMVTTSLVSNSPSWIAKGDKYYSLCLPNRRKVACAPIVATSVMQDIEVGALAGPKGEPLLTFKIAVDAKQAPKRLAYAINYFLARTNRQVAHFNRMAPSYVARPKTRAASSWDSRRSAFVADSAGGAGACSYDDDGSYDCTGGAIGGGDGGGGGDGEGGEDPVPGPMP